MPILIPCPHCEDGTRWKSRYGGNDPDVWAVRCDECDGEGEIVAGCQHCRADATEVFDDLRLCAVCADELRHDAIREMTDAE